MLELSMNGKSLSDNDIVVLINRDSILNMTDLKFFTDDGEVALDDTNAAIDITINIMYVRKLTRTKENPPLIR